MNKIIKYLTLGLSSILIGCSINYANLNHKQVIKKVSTLEQAKKYCLDYLGKKYDFENHDQEDYWSSFKKTHERKDGDCEDGTLAVIALLSDDGYGAKTLILEKINFKTFKRIGHCVFLYEKDEKFGSGGMNKSDWKLPTYNTIEELVKSFKKYDIYHVLDFSDSLDSIINSDNNLTGLFLWKYGRAEAHFIDD